MKDKHATTIRKVDERPTCSHYQKQGHKEAKCWVLHLELKPKWFKDRKGKQKAMVIVEDIGSDFEDETKIKIIGVKGKILLLMILTLVLHVLLLLKIMSVLRIEK